MKYLIGLCILACSVVPGFGTTILVSFDQATGDQTATHTYTGVPSGSIMATAYGTGAPDLFGKAGGGDENGVGLTTDPTGCPSACEHEITPGGFIQLDLTGITGPVTITMGSTTDGEKYSIFGSSGATNTTIANVLHTCDSTSTNCETSFTITPTLQYLDFTSTSGNVLLSSLSYNTGVPEPVSFVLAGTGLLGIYFMRRRKTGSR